MLYQRIKHCSVGCLQIVIWLCGVWHVLWGCALLARQLLQWPTSGIPHQPAAVDATIVGSSAPAPSLSESHGGATAIAAGDVMALPLLAASGVGVVFREHMTTSPPVRSDSCEAIVPLDEMRWIRVSRISSGTGKRPSAVTPPVPRYLLLLRNQIARLVSSSDASRSLLPFVSQRARHPHRPARSRDSRGSRLTPTRIRGEAFRVTRAGSG